MFIPPISFTLICHPNKIWWRVNLIELLIMPILLANFIFTLLGANIAWSQLVTLQAPRDAKQVTVWGIFVTAVNTAELEGIYCRFYVLGESLYAAGLLPQLLLSFSAVQNSRKILNCDTQEDSLTSLHGLRFLSLAWVILVHTYLQVFAIAGKQAHIGRCTQSNSTLGVILSDFRCPRKWAASVVNLVTKVILVCIVTKFLSVSMVTKIIWLQRSLR